MWFRKTRPVEPTETVEVAAHKRATKRQITDVKKQSASVNQQFEDNGFTFQIYLAAGGKHLGGGK
jgi:uncharacterized protein YgfB (UPF0149 family)